MFNLLLILHFVLIHCCCSMIVKFPVVQILDGRILGSQSITPEGKLFYRFQGIPYAASPVGNLRLANPEPPSKWSDVKNCTQKNIICIQTREYVSEYETEDCLILNVYTTKLTNASEIADLPVMVYFYGGGFYIGNSTYDAYGPDFFMDYDVVIVTINYRLGPFGFLSTGDSVIPGNFGFKDQQLALKWVQKNIYSFGGDPEKVTIFGNSAGSASVGYQVLNRESAGLFRAAIMSSGNPMNPWTFQENPRKVLRETVLSINNNMKSFESSAEILGFLRSVEASDIRKASLDVMDSVSSELVLSIDGYPYAAVMESHSEDGFLKNNIYETVENGNFSHIPLMMGFTSEEFIYFATDDMDSFRSLLKLFDSNHESMLDNEIRSNNDEGNKFRAGLIYRVYAQNETFEENLAKGVRFFSDQCINNGILKFAQLASNYTDVFLYQFSFNGLMGNYSQFTEVTHTEDMNYIWRRNIPTANNMDLEKFPETDRLIQKRLLTLYTNFAKYLKPTPKKDEILQNIEWTTVNSKGSNNSVYMDINTNLEMKLNPKYDTYSKWNDLFSKYAVRPYNTF